MRFRGTCYRAHDPRWAFKPLSGEGAAVHGGRFNAAGVPALYLSLNIEGAVREANQGFPFKIDPCILCSYTVDCDGIVDLTNEAERSRIDAPLDHLASAWFAIARGGKTPPSWRIASRLIAAGHSGVLVPSFAPGAAREDRNLVLWRWGPRLPYRVRVFDPSGRLPKNQLSWN